MNDQEKMNEIEIHYTIFKSYFKAYKSLDEIEKECREKEGQGNFGPMMCGYLSAYYKMLRKDCEFFINRMEEMRRNENV